MNGALVQELLARAARAKINTDHRMNTELMVPCKIDEVSVLLGTPRQLDAFVEEAKAQGWEHFNSVPSDVMHLKREGIASGITAPSDVDLPDWISLVGSGWEFLVRFEFLRLPGADWRIEAMCVLNGMAPLHLEHLLTPGKGPGSVMHASYKPPGLDGSDWASKYLEHKQMLARLLDYKCEYDNSYGVFSYFQFGNWYLKPRVNTRDA